MFSILKNFVRLKWRDKASYLIFAASSPWILLKTSLFAVPTAVYTFVVWMKWHKTASSFESAIYRTANVINKIEWYPIMFLSYLLNWRKAKQNYRNNANVISYLEHIAPSNQKIMIGQLSHNLTNAAKKEGWLEVYLKMLTMHSFLPTYRHIFLNNPFLFEYKLVFTNQMTEPTKNQTCLPHILFSYIGDPEFLLKLESNCGQWNIDKLGFTPNYFNNTQDTIIDHNNMGLQIAAYCATNIYLDTIIKTPEELAIQLQHNTSTLSPSPPSSLGQIGHTYFNDALSSNIPIKYLRPLDSRRRIPFLNLAVPYQSHYHFITGVVEANIVLDTKGQIIEHPMLCLYHDGIQMEYLWTSINNLFDHFVMGYLTHSTNHAH